MTHFHRFLVGGAVRDRFLGRPCKDFDFTVESDSYDTMKSCLLDEGYTIFVEKPEYLTIRAKAPGGMTSDFVLARKDGAYSDGRRPDAVVPGTILDDLARRDFTMNAIAVSDSGAIIDPFDGQTDIRNGIIRCVGVTQNRLAEDSLRILRALRFSVTLGFRLDIQLHDCLTFGRDLVASLKNVSTDRVRDELTKMFRHDTFATLRIFRAFPLVEQAVFSRDIWLMPTTKDK